MTDTYNVSKILFAIVVFFPFLAIAFVAMWVEGGNFGKFSFIMIPILSVKMIQLDIETEKLKEKKEQKIIRTYKESLSNKEIQFIESICGYNLKCWDKERAILSGMQVKREIRGKFSKNIYYRNGVEVYKD